MIRRTLLFTILTVLLVLTAASPAVAASYRVNIRSGSHDLEVTYLRLTHEGNTIWECADVPIVLGPGETERLSTGELQTVPNDYHIKYKLDGGNQREHSVYPMELDTWYKLPGGKGNPGTDPELMVQDEANAVEPGSLGKVKAIFN